MCETQYNKNGFEIETCSRCGGSGEYSYCEMCGSTCFKCGGKRVVYTKRGSAAVTFYTELFKVTAGEIKVGDWMGPIDPRGGKKAQVTSVESIELKGSSNGVPYCEQGVRISTLQGSLICGLDYKVMKMATAEVIAERLAKAMEYQASLTKMGKPRKTKVA